MLMRNKHHWVGTSELSKITFSLAEESIDSILRQTLDTLNAGDHSILQGITIIEYRQTYITI